MLRLRLLAASVAMVVAGSFAGTALAARNAAPAAAQPPATGSITSSIPCLSLGVADTCTVTVTSLQLVNGVLTAVGTITNSAGTISIPFQAPLQFTGTCRILDLTLGPLHLDLLGLVVDLNQVHLTITAVSGPGNLLGNLLCAVAHLLDNAGSVNGLQNLLNLLNGILIL